MSFCLVTTTINVPRVLEAYRACGHHITFIIAADQKTPLSPSHDNLLFLTPAAQTEWNCSELIGWNCVQRRNIAFLEALKRGSAVEWVVSIDDDNIPMDGDYFLDLHLTQRTPKIKVIGDDDWFDVGQLLIPKAPHRGFPRLHHDVRYTHSYNHKVGVAAGICLGDPDIDAVTRIANEPEVHNVSQLLQSGVVVEPKTWTVFNSQNTAIRREFIPAWFMWPFVGRMDDIYASLIVQRVMRDRGYCVHFGKPFVWQTRNDHNLVNDLRGEIDGYDNVAKLAEILDHIILLNKSVIDDCRIIWNVLEQVAWVPTPTVKAAKAYLDDCEKVL